MGAGLFASMVERKHHTHLHLISFVSPLLPPPAPPPPLPPPTALQRVHLIMELCEGGELFERISARRHYPEAEAAAVCRTLVSVVQHCQAHGVMHRDLKPENVLLLSKESNTDVKVVDYGLATFVKPGEEGRGA